MEQALAQWAHVFLEDLTGARRCSPHTVQAYRRDLERFLQTQRLGGSAPADRVLTTRRFQDFLASLAVDGLANRSIARAAASLRSFMGFLYRRGAIPHDWSDRVPSVKFAPSLPRFVGESQMREWLESLPGRTHWELRDRCLVVILYATGARLSELVGLNWGDFDSESRALRLFGKRSRERVVPTGEYLANSLLELKAQSPEAAFGEKKPILINRRGGRLTGRSVARILQRSFAAAVGGGVSPHRLRHSFATHMLDHGADLMALKELLGHQDAATTQIYTHTSLEHLSRVYREAFPGDRA
ncbi:MAG: tyrosine-type recombinase/integrase [candidate division Zixibacteria bacterium]|nr:tyrosine-type recombinase/integrase [candidate division Zixibacteria bacterium]